MLVNFKGLINPTKEDVIEYLGERYNGNSKEDELNAFYVDNENVEYSVYIKNNSPDTDDLILFELNDGYISTFSMPIGVFEIVDDTITTKKIESHKKEFDYSSSPICNTSDSEVKIIRSREQEITDRLLDIIEKSFTK